MSTPVPTQETPKPLARPAPAAEAADAAAPVRLAAEAVPERGPRHLTGRRRLVTAAVIVAGLIAAAAGVVFVFPAGDGMHGLEIPGDGTTGDSGSTGGTDSMPAPRPREEPGPPAAGAGPAGGADVKTPAADQPLAIGASRETTAAAPGMTPAPAPGGELSARECLDLSAAALADNRLTEALRALELGLTVAAPDDAGTRALIFERLAEANARLGREAAAALFRDNARRLAREAAGPALLMELARESRRAGDFREERRRLHRFILASGGLADREALASGALADIADSLAEEWKSLRQGPDPEALVEPTLVFEGRR